PRTDITMHMMPRMQTKRRNRSGQKSLLGVSIYALRHATFLILWRGSRHPPRGEFQLTTKINRNQDGHHRTGKKYDRARGASDFPKPPSDANYAPPQQLTKDTAQYRPVRTVPAQEHQEERQGKVSTVSYMPWWIDEASLGCA
ncbi:hypothetical protein DXG01_016834, partial [Tephrocybe rancida]